MAKDSHLVLNKYERNDSNNPNQDISTIYHGRNPAMAKDLYHSCTKEEEDEALMNTAIIRRRKSLASGQSPSMALHIQTFQHHGFLSRYRAFNTRSRSMPAFTSTEQYKGDEGMDVGKPQASNALPLTCSRYDHERQLQQMEEDANRIKRNKSMSAMDITLPEPLQLLRTKGIEGVVTFRYQSISMDDISPIQQTEPPMNEPNINPFLYDTDDSIKKPEEHDFMVIG